ncbi:hypothetical protein Tsubulata_007571, partial [Turnera subulata]
AWIEGAKELKHAVSEKLTKACRYNSGKTQVDRRSDETWHRTSLPLLSDFASSGNMATMFPVDEIWGKFKDNLIKDSQGLLSLYEASYLGMHGETILDEAQEFTKAHLKSLMSTQILASPLSEQVSRALQRPLHRTPAKIEQLHYISVYEKEDAHNEAVLRLAKLDFNIVQNVYQEEIRNYEYNSDGTDRDACNYVGQVVDRIGFGKKAAAFPEPQLSFSRRIISKGALIFTIVDDLYDSYATLDELELFTHAFQRWDTSMEGLQAVVDFVEEIKEETTKMGRPYCAEYVKEAINDNLRTYLREARWCKRCYVPTLEEYRENGGVSTGLPSLTFQSFGGLEDVSEEVFHWLVSEPKILTASADHCRLMDDIAGHEVEQKRGDHVASSVECYMAQHGASKEEARDAIKKFIEADWKYLNEEVFKEAGTIPKRVLTIFLRYARLMDELYGGDFDGYTNATTTTKDMMAALLVHPLPV